MIQVTNAMKIRNASGEWVTVEAIKGDKPVITASKSGTTTTIYADGVALGQIVDGAKGATPNITSSKSGKITTLFADGTKFAEIMDGDVTAAAIEAALGVNIVSEVGSLKTDFNALDERVTALEEGGTGVDLDPSLTDPLKAAPADAVGNLDGFVREVRTIITQIPVNVDATGIHISDTYSVNFKAGVTLKYRMINDGVINTQPIAGYYFTADGTRVRWLDIYDTYKVDAVAPIDIEKVAFYAVSAAVAQAGTIAIEFVQTVINEDSLESRIATNADKISKVETDVKPITDNLGNYIVYRDDERIVSGTGTYIYYDMYLDNISLDDYYTLFCESVTGATKSAPFSIYFVNSSGQNIKQYDVAGYNDIVFAFKPIENTARIRVRYYASISGAVTAVYKSVLITKGKRSTVKSGYALIDAINDTEYTNHKSATMLSIAHRGYWADSTECLAKAVINGRKYGFDVVENDLNLTADGQYVMWHDANLTKVGHPEITLSSKTLAELKAMDFNGESILTLDEWLMLCKKMGVKALLDTKITITDAIAEEVVQKVKRIGMQGNVLYFTYTNYRKYDPHCTIVFLIAPTASNVVSQKALLDDGDVIFMAHAKDVTAENTALGLENGFGVMCWTMEQGSYGYPTHAEFIADLNRCIECGVQGINCDNHTVDMIVRESVGF